jgi:hypothetical protein
LGLALGPSLLGVIEREWVDDFKPVMLAGTAWLSFCAGLATAAAVHDDATKGSTSKRAERLGLPLVGWLLTAIVAAGVAMACWLALGWTQVTTGDRLILSGGAAAVTGSFAPKGAQVSSPRDDNPASLRRLLRLNRLAALVPSGIVAWLLASTPDHGLAELPDAARVVVTLAVGAVLGGLTALLTSHGRHSEQRWALLLGSSMLATGVTLRLNLSSVAALFVMGLVLALLSDQRDALWDMVWPTQRAVLFPVALLTGAWVAVPTTAWAATLAVSALLAGFLLSALRAAAASALTKPAEQRVSVAKVGLLLPGAFGMCVAVELAARLETHQGTVLLSVGAATLLAGHGIDLLLALPSLRRSDPPEERTTPDAAPLHVGQTAAAGGSKLGVE